MPDDSIKSQLPEGVMTPEEIAKSEKAIKSKEAAPRVQEQSGSFADWKNLQNQLGQPHDIERIPLKKLRQMRLDTMISFGLHYKKSPMARANFHFEAVDKDGKNPQIAGFFDSAWRPIHGTYIFQHTNDLDFGFATLVKRFAQGNPGGVYVDDTEENPENKLKPVWSEGTIDPIIWRTFVGLPPERVQPQFNKLGEFDGIIYETLPSQQGRATGFASAASKGNDNERIIDVHRALWITNDKHLMHGNIFGYPLIGRAYRYWWSYWFRWAMADRAFERLAVPPLIAYHPPGDFVDPEDPTDRMPYSDIALNAAESLRSNAIAAVPSTLATAGVEERGTQMREWEFKYLETNGAYSADLFDKSFTYLDAMKLRSLWVPEQAFIEGEGGSSSRNVAAQMNEVFNTSQANKMDDIAFHLNSYVFPQIAAVNFPEFVANGGRVKIVIHGFAKEDLEIQKQIIQVIGQSDPAQLGVDIKEILTQMNVPVLTPVEQAEQQNRLITELAQQGPPNVPGVTTNIQGFNPGGTNGGSQPEPGAFGQSLTGFSDEPRYVYYKGDEYIELSDNDDFLAALPQTTHYEDKAMRALAVQMRRAWLSHLKKMYPDFAKYVEEAKIELTDEEISELGVIELADEKKRPTKRQALQIANRIIKDWSFSSAQIKKIQSISENIIDRMTRRAIKQNAKKHGVKAEIDEEDIKAYVTRQTGLLIKSVHGTAKEDLKTFLANAIMQDLEPKVISKGIRERFKEVEEWKADSIARSEVRDAHNESAILVSEAGEFKYLRAKDAQLGPTDKDCEARDGKLFTPAEARKEASHEKTHTNCTLELEPVASAEFSIVSSDLPEDAPDGAEAWFDAATCTAYAPLHLSDEDTKEFLNAVVDHLGAK